MSPLKRLFIFCDKALEMMDSHPTEKMCNLFANLELWKLAALIMRKKEGA
jgi:hypothetical protein